MSENSENLIVEHLRIIRSDVGNIRQDMAEVRMRLTSIEERLTLVEKGIANVHGDLAIVQTGLDRPGERIERIEKKRLDLTAT